ncbi:hypothetical protein CPAV1605_1536 [seawater metagenome]|uniref:Uncharacterized protein n=1 Tax=seawater metagenome TaxID=1561972 RepID=A0A5E8CMK8_9ZZZZ
MIKNHSLNFYLKNKNYIGGSLEDNQDDLLLSIDANSPDLVVHNFKSLLSTNDFSRIKTFLDRFQGIPDHLPLIVVNADIPTNLKLELFDYFYSKSISINYTMGERIINCFTDYIKKLASFMISNTQLAETSYSSSNLFSFSEPNTQEFTATIESFNISMTLLNKLLEMTNLRGKNFFLIDDYYYFVKFFNFLHDANIPEAMIVKFMQAVQPIQNIDNICKQLGALRNENLVSFIFHIRSYKDPDFLITIFIHIWKTNPELDINFFLKFFSKNFVLSINRILTSLEPAFIRSHNYFIEFFYNLENFIKTQRNQNMVEFTRFNNHSLHFRIF